MCLHYNRGGIGGRTLVPHDGDFVSNPVSQSYLSHFQYICLHWYYTSDESLSVVPSAHNPQFSHSQSINFGSFENTSILIVFTILFTILIIVYLIYQICILYSFILKYILKVQNTPSIRNTLSVLKIFRVFNIQQMF